MASRVATKTLTRPQLWHFHDFLSTSYSTSIHSFPIDDCRCLPRAPTIATPLLLPKIPSFILFTSRSICALYSKFEVGASVSGSCHAQSALSTQKSRSICALYSKFEVGASVAGSWHAQSALLPTQNLRWAHRFLCPQRSSHSSTEHTNTSIQCWSCGTKLNKRNLLICPSCNAVQTADLSIDYFEMFDVDKKYELDLKDLEGRYKNLMRKLHPDLFHGKSTEEQVNSAQLASLVTRAYDELFKPVSRATYLLKLQGIHIEEEGTVNDPELIMEVMEIRENFEHASDEKTLKQLCDTSKARMNEWTSSFTTALKEDNKTAAVAALQRMSYFNGIYEDIRRKLL